MLDMEGSLTESQTVYCLNEILKALQFMHQNNIAHLDVKPQNILMNGERIEGKLGVIIENFFCFIEFNSWHYKLRLALQNKVLNYRP